MSKPSDLPEILREYFLKQSVYTYKKGETVIRQEDEPSGVYYIEKGFVKAFTYSISGEEKFHFIYKKGEIFPLGWALNDKKNRTQFEAMSKTILRRCSRTKFIDFLNKNEMPTVDFSQYLVDKISLYAQRLSNLETTNSYPRIIIFLLFLAKRVGREKEGKIVFDLVLNQRDIANAVNVTRETASRELTKLAKKGFIVSSTRSSITIYNISGLENELLAYYDAK